MKYAIARQRDNSVLLHNNIDSNQHAIEKHNTILKKISIELNNELNSIKRTNDELMELQNYIELETILDSLMDIEEALADIISDGKRGICNLKGLNKDFLIANLRALESNRQGLSPIFASWEWESYYKHELCNIAKNRDEIWVTIRIPIVRHNELMARVGLTSSFSWIKSSADELGYEIDLFRETEHDTFSIMTKSNYEMCSVLGTARVCNVRKTKFRENFHFIVPLEISKNRVLILSNITSNMSIESVYNCKERIERIRMSHTILLKIPSDCSTKSKSFEIEKVAKHEFVTDDMEFETVDKIEYKKLMRPNISRSNSKEIMNADTDKPSLSNNKEFELNNNLTNEALQKIVTNHEGIFDDLRFMKIGGFTSSAFLVAIFATLAVIWTLKKCRKDEGKNGISINLDLTKNENSKSTANRLSSNHENADEMEREIPEPEILPETANASNDIDSREIINKQFARRN